MVKYRYRIAKLIESLPKVFTKDWRYVCLKENCCLKGVSELEVVSKVLDWLKLEDLGFFKIQAGSLF
jgi:hypothetical protein